MRGAHRARVCKTRFDGRLLVSGVSAGLRLLVKRKWLFVLFLLVGFVASGAAPWMGGWRGWTRFCGIAGSRWPFLLARVRIDAFGCAIFSWVAWTVFGGTAFSWLPCLPRWRCSWVWRLFMNVGLVRWVLLAAQLLAWRRLFDVTFGMLILDGDGFEWRCEAGLLYSFCTVALWALGSSACSIHLRC